MYIYTALLAQVANLPPIQIHPINVCLMSTYIPITYHDQIQCDVAEFPNG